MCHCGHDWFRHFCDLQPGGKKPYSILPRWCNACECLEYHTEGTPMLVASCQKCHEELQHSACSLIKRPWEAVVLS